MKKLTVMISAYESGEFLKGRLDNLLQSTAIRDMEIWVLNANSPDPRDHEIPKKFPIKYHRLKERVGVYAAWNWIINNTDSKYITNANADDLIAPNGYDQLMRALDKKGDHGFAYPSWYNTSIANLYWGEVRRNASSDGKPGVYSGDLGKAGVGHFPLWRRSLHKSFGMFDESFKALGDAEWWARCYYKGKIKFHWVRSPLACYLFRNGQNLWHREVNEDEWARYHNKVNEYRSG
jgi:glycosyltransferase involved in cell wall biosynthesis